jgi:antitoxin (DNA-binding transcriptional repressor) of toxin-antitoxin stability system
MKTVDWTDDRPMGEILGGDPKEDVVLFRDGHPVALVIPFDEDDLEWYARERDPEFLASLARAREQVANGQTIGHEALKRELGLDDDAGEA